MGQLDHDQLTRFRRKGYLVVEDLIDPERFLDPLVAESELRLEDLACELQRDGLVESTYAGLGFSERLTPIYQDVQTGHMVDRCSETWWTPRPAPADPACPGRRSESG